MSINAVDGASSQQQRHKRTVFVGGLADAADEATLVAAFAPFGDVVDVQIPRDVAAADGAGTTGSTTLRHRGFGFVTFSTPDEAHDAIDNMHLNEVANRVVNVNIARPMKTAVGSSSRAVWQDEEWIREYAMPEEERVPTATDGAADGGAQ